MPPLHPHFASQRRSRLQQQQQPPPPPQQQQPPLPPPQQQHPPHEIDPALAAASHGTQAYAGAYAGGTLGYQYDPAAPPMDRAPFDDATRVARQSGESLGGADSNATYPPTPKSSCRPCALGGRSSRRGGRLCSTATGAPAAAAAAISSASGTRATRGSAHGAA